MHIRPQNDWKTPLIEKQGAGSASPPRRQKPRATSRWKLWSTRRTKQSGPAKRPLLRFSTAPSRMFPIIWERYLQVVNWSVPRSSKKFLTTAQSGARGLSEDKVLYYNLDAIISVGYRINSLRGVRGKTLCLG